MLALLRSDCRSQLCHGEPLKVDDLSERNINDLVTQRATVVDNSEGSFLGRQAGRRELARMWEALKYDVEE
jgi:hypothetical protein